MTNMTNDENGLQILSGSLVLCFDTLAEALESLSKMPYGIKFKVTSDGDKNGRYTWDGSQLSKTTNNVLDKIKEEAEKIVEEATKDSVNKDNILDILNGEVNLSILEAELAERIEAIPDISNKVNELSKRTEGLSEDLDKKVNRVNNLVDDLDYTLNDIRNNLGLTDFTDINNKIDELQKQVTDDYNAVLAKVDELQKEADLALKDVLVEVDGIKADVAQEVSDRIDAIRAENASRIEAIENLQDGITQEKNERIEGETKIISSLENYKASNDTSMANFQEKLDVVVEESKASIEKVESMDARVKSAEDASGNALTNSANALEKVTTVVTDLEATAKKVDSLEANVETAIDESGKALTNSANALKEAETAVSKTSALAEDFTTLKTTVEGEVKTNADAISGLKTQVSDVDGKIDAESKRIDALSGSIEGKADGSALDELKVTVSDQGDALKSQSQSILALDNSIKGKADSSSVDSLKSTVEAQGEDIKAQGQALTGLTNSLTGKADASAVDLLKTEVSEIGGKLETQAKSITSLEGSVSKKADTSALSALETTVIQQGKDISSQATEVTGLKASLAGAYSGSSNLVKNSNLLEGFSLVGTGTLKALDASVAKTSALFVEAKATKASDVFGLRTVGTFALKSGVTYTLTYRCTSSPQKISVALVNSAGTVEKVISDSAVSTDTLTNATTKKVTFSYDGTPSGNLYLKFFVKTAVVNSVVNLTEPMLIEGTLGASWAKSPDDFATGSAVESLTTRVGKTEETITSQGQALTGLRSDVDNKASSQAVSELTTKVEVQGATLNDQGQLITEQGIIIDNQGNVLDEQGKIVATTSKDLADLGITVKSQGQSIDSLQTTIKGKADSSALNTLETTVIDQGKKLESQSTAITSVQTTIGDLKVGGTNLLASTAKDGFEKSGTGTFTDVENLGFKTSVLKMIRGTTNLTTFAGFASKSANSKITLRAGVVYTVSFKARGSMKPDAVILTKASSTSGDLAVASGNFKGLTSVNSSTFVVVSGKITPSVDVKGVGGLKIGNSSGSANNWLEVAEVIVQEGDVVTDWMPSSQDLDAIKSLADASASGFSTLTAKVDKNAEDITAQSKKIDNVEASIKDKADVSAVSALGVKVEEQAGKISSQSDQITELGNTVSNIRVGGKNLLGGTNWRNVDDVNNMNKNNGLIWGTANLASYISFSRVGGQTAGIRINSKDAVGSLGFMSHETEGKASVIAGRTYTLSFVGQGTFSSLNYCYLLYPEGTENQPLGRMSFGSGGNTRRSITFEASVTSDNVRVLIGSNRTWLSTDWFSVAEVQLEEGNMATDWSPSIVKEVNTTNSAVSALTTKVEANEKSISTQASDISKLNTSVAGKADTSAVNALTTRVTTAEGKINTNTANISSLTTTVGKKADASAVSALEIDVTKLGENYNSVSSSMTALESSYQSTITELSIDGGLRTENLVRNTDVAEVVKVESTTATGGYIWKIGNNEGNDNAWIHTKDMMNIDPNKLYKVTAKFKRVSGTGTVYVGVACKRSKDGVYITSGNATNNGLSSSIYLYSNQSPALGTDVEVEYYMKGKSTGASTGLGTLASPRTFPAKANMFAPLFIANYASASGEVELEFVRVSLDEVTEGFTSSGKAITELQTKTSTIDGNVSTISTKVGNLESTVNDATTGLKTKASVVQLDTAKSDLNSAITSMDTKLTARLDGISQYSNMLVNGNMKLSGETIMSNVSNAEFTDDAGGTHVTSYELVPASTNRYWTMKVDSGYKIGNNLYQFLVNTGDTYYVEAEVYSELARNIRLTADFRNISGTNLATKNAESFNGSYIGGNIPAKTWTKISGVHRVTGTGVAILNTIIRVTTNASAGGVWAKNVKLCKLSEESSLTATAISSTQADVSRIDGVLVSQASQVTALEARGAGDQATNLLAGYDYSQPERWSGSFKSYFTQRQPSADATYAPTMYPYPAMTTVYTATTGTANAFRIDMYHEKVPLISGRTYSLSGKFRTHLNNSKGTLQIRVLTHNATDLTAVRNLTIFSCDLGNNSKTLHDFLYRITLAEGENSIRLQVRLQNDANGDASISYISFPDLRLEAESSTVSTAINELTTSVEQNGKDIVAQSKATTNLEAKLGNQKIGGTNVLKGTQKGGFIKYGTVSASTVAETTSTAFKTSIYRIDRLTASTGIGITTSATNKVGTLKNGNEYTLTFLARGTAPLNYVYTMGSSSSGANVNIGAPTAVGGLSETEFRKFTRTFTANFDAIDKVGILIGNINGTVGQWLEVAEVIVQEGNTPTDWQASYLDVPEIDLSGYATAKALSEVTVRVEDTEKGLSTQAKSIDKLVTSDGKNTSAVATQAESINGLSAQWTLKTDVNGYVSGMGTYNTGTTSEIVFRTDKFSIANPTGTGKTSGFVYQASPVTLPNGTVIPAGLKVNSAVIGELDAKKIRADSISAISGNLGTFTTVGSDGSKQIISGGKTEIYYPSGQIAVRLGLY